MFLPYDSTERGKVQAAKSRNLVIFRNSLQESAQKCRMFLYKYDLEGNAAMTLNDTIRALRRERGMTQEQLAEAMNVSAAAVSKWENGQSVPDILVLTALADFFEVSLDALVGYTVQAHRRGDMVARIRQLVVQKKHTEATRAAREALRRYPNSFDVVYEATQAYGYSGMEQNRPEDLRKALSLAERAMVLITQDQEREKHIRPESIWSLMGNYHAHLNEYDEAIRCYENGNVAEVNDIAIANSQTELGCYDHALPKLSRGLVVSVIRLFNAATGRYELPDSFRSAAGRDCAGIVALPRARWHGKHVGQLYLEDENNSVHQFRTGNGAHGAHERRGIAAAAGDSLRSPLRCRTELQRERLPLLLGRGEVDSGHYRRNGNERD